MNHLLQIFSSTGDYKGYEALINLREMAPQVKRKPAANARSFDHSAARLLPSISTEDSESRSSNKRSPSSSTRALSPNSGFDKKDDDDDNEVVESAKLQPPLTSPPPTSPSATRIATIRSRTTRRRRRKLKLTEQTTRRRYYRRKTKMWSQRTGAAHRR